MTRPRDKLRCPACGAEMNHHASKCVDPTDPREAALVDPDLGGIVREVYACPACGQIASRVAQPRLAVS